MAIKLLATINPLTGRFGPDSVDVGAYPIIERDSVSWHERTISFNLKLQLEGSSGLVAEVVEKVKSAEEVIDELISRFEGEVVYRTSCTILATFRPETTEQLQSYLKKTRNL